MTQDRQSGVFIHKKTPQPEGRGGKFDNVDCKYVV